MEDKKVEEQIPDLINEAELTEDELAEIVGGASWWKEDLRAAVQAVNAYQPADLRALKIPGPHLGK